MHVQVDTHDSIEDARAALHLYYVYKELMESDDPDAFSKKLAQIYSAGNRSNWDPETDWTEFESSKPLLPVTPGQLPANAAKHAKGVQGSGLTPVTPEGYMPPKTAAAAAEEGASVVQTSLDAGAHSAQPESSPALQPSSGLVPVTPTESDIPLDLTGLADALDE